MLELKTCPFCGGEAKLIEGSYSEDGRRDRAWVVYCESCGARKSKAPDWSNWNPYHERSGVCEAAMHNAIVEAWNTRHEQTCHPVDAFDKKTRLIVERGQTYYYWPYSGCSGCGCDFPQGSNFCPNCGSKVVE